MLPGAQNHVIYVGVRKPRRISKLPTGSSRPGRQGQRGKDKMRPEGNMARGDARTKETVPKKDDTTLHVSTN